MELFPTPPFWFATRTVRSGCERLISVTVLMLGRSYGQRHALTCGYRSGAPDAHLSGIGAAGWLPVAVVAALAVVVATTLALAVAVVVAAVVPFLLPVQMRMTTASLTAQHMRTNHAVCLAVLMVFCSPVIMRRYMADCHAAELAVHMAITMGLDAGLLRSQMMVR